MLSAVWSLALIGVLMKVWFIRMPRSVSTVFYIMLGWIAIVPFWKLVSSFPIEATILMIVGGVMYTIGGIIYATKIFDFVPNRFGFHEIFHLFVMAGTLAHFIMIAGYILPQ